MRRLVELDEITGETRPIPTQVEQTEKWIEANQDWLTDDHAPMTMQLLLLAQSMDSDMRSRGIIQSAMANAYRAAYRTLMDLKLLGERVNPEPDDSLLSPGAW